MSKDRKYNEKEIAAIFKQAARDFESAQQKVHSGDGLTLAEIETIAEEVGISSGFVKRAAAKVDLRHRSAADKKIIGLPFQINRVVQLPESFGDKEWDKLIVDLHDSYGVVGTIKESRQGRMKSWVTDNIQVHVEPTGDGSRLRITSTNGINTLMLLFGGIFFFVSIMFMAILMTKGKFMTAADDTLLMFILSLSGLSIGGFGASQLPGWQKSEEQRIDSIITRALDSPPDEYSRLPREHTEEGSRLGIDAKDRYGDVDPVGRKNRLKGLQ